MKVVVCSVGRRGRRRRAHSLDTLAPDGAAHHTGECAAPGAGQVTEGPVQGVGPPVGRSGPLIGRVTSLGGTGGRWLLDKLDGNALTQHGHWVPHPVKDNTG